MNDPLGARRTRVQIQAATEAPDGLGQLQPGWDTVYTCWALKRALSGREATNALQTKAVVSFVLETWTPRAVEVTPAHRVLIGTVPYGISWVNDVDGRGETLLIYCTGQAAPAESA